MSKKNKKYQELFDEMIEAMLLEEESNPPQGISFSWDDYGIEEAFEADEAYIPTHQPEKELTSSGVHNYSEDISEEDFDDLFDLYCGEKTPRKKDDGLLKAFHNMEQGENHLVEESHSAIQSQANRLSLPKKQESKKNDLYGMEKTLLDCVKIIRHDGGVYYFNGKCYTAIRNDMDLLELVRSRVSTTAFAVGSVKCFQDLLTFLKTDPALIPNHYDEKLKKANRLISLRNGILNIHTLELLDFDSKHLVFHNIDARWTDQYPNTFLNFLYESCQDEEVVKLTTEVIGYLLAGSIFAKKFFVIGTARDSGKSTLAELIVKLVGEDQMISVEPNKLHERFALGSSRGKILGVSMDIPKGKLCPAAVSKIKAISGLDYTSLEQKYAPMEFSRSNLRFLLGTNFPITLGTNEDDVDEAFWERLVAIPFTHTIDPAKKDVNLGSRLWEERDAIVSFCLRSYRDVYERGYVFSYCQASEEMKASWRYGNALSCYSFSAFWADYVEITESPKDGVFTQDLHEAYVQYCRARGLEFIYHSDMVRWIDANYGSQIGERDRFRMGSPVARWGYHGIKLHYQGD